MLETKICTGCKLPKPLNEFGNNKRNKDGKQYWCKECSTKEALAWRVLNPERYKNHYTKHNKSEKSKIARQTYRASDKGKKSNKKYLTKWRKTDEGKAVMKAYYDNNIKTLGTNYIKSMLSRDGLSFSEIPQELVEFKREQLKLFRATKQ